MMRWTVDGSTDISEYVVVGGSIVVLRGTFIVGAFEWTKQFYRSLPREQTGSWVVSSGYMW